MSQADPNVSQGASSPAIRAVALTKIFRIYSSLGRRLMDSLLKTGRGATREIIGLSEVDLRVERGECLGIMGPNGAGKSTLLKVLNRALLPTSGSLEVSGRVAMLDLGAAMNPQLSGRDNLIVGGLSLGLSRREIEESIDEWIEFAELGKAIDDPMYTYSTGMAMRLAFSLNAHIGADILIIDEAFAVGDARFVLKCRRKIEAMRAKGSTILLASHDANAIAELCDRAILLDRGRVVTEGDAVRVGDAYHKILGSTAAPPNAGTSRDEGVIPPATVETFLRDAIQRHPRSSTDSGVEILGLRVDRGGHPCHGLLHHGDRCEVTWLVKAERPYENLTSGVHIHSQFGTYVFGTSYVHLGQPIEIDEAGYYLLSIRLHVGLGPGKYVLSLGVAQPDLDVNALGGDQLDRFRSAYEFEVRDFTLGRAEPVPFFGLVRLEASAETPRRLDG